ncbi:uncharacterized protein LOC142221942 [Haematobia irritans]|uniref:uncharacterized protein LOC142221942 n=1 Tax=Haematobia irritans TaxID=7368 RepID=UPI003F50CA21
MSTGKNYETAMMLMVSSSQTHVNKANVVAIREILNQEVSMACQAAKQTMHMTLKKSHGNTFESAETTEAVSATQRATLMAKPKMTITTTKTPSVKKVNKQNKLQHKQPQQHQKTENCSSNNNSNSISRNGNNICNSDKLSLMLTEELQHEQNKKQHSNIGPSDPAAIRANTTATSLLSTLVAKTAAADAVTETTAAPTFTRATIKTKALAKDTENALNETQWANVCFNSNKGCPKQKFATTTTTTATTDDDVHTHPRSNQQQQQQQQAKQNEQQRETDEQLQHHPCVDANVRHVHEAYTQAYCRSANISHGSSNSNIRTVPQINKKNIANITTTTNTTIIANNTTGCINNKKSSSRSNSIIISNPIAKATTNATTTYDISSSATLPLVGIKNLLLPVLLGQRLRLGHVMQMDSMLRVLMFGFVFIIMSLQFQTVTASASMQPKHEPMFISRSETFKFVAGDTIVLPCEVANTEPYVVAWKRGIAILTAGSVKVTPDPRVRLVNGFNLQIRDAVPQDAGDYICQIATMEPREITHTVEILVPPRIHHMSSSGHLQVKKGSSVRIECSASGNPTPNVTWSRKNNILPNGEEKLHSHILSIENVDRHKGGVYICTANNGVGQPASSQVILHVLYPPEINVERPVVFSGEGHEAMLVCIVHGETQPEVIWFKDTMQLDTTERHIMENRGSRHTLIIRKVHPQDFGNYSCVAENQLGKSRKTLQLSGKPNVPVFNSPPVSQYKDRYNISWTVESHAPIEEYKLSFRRLQQGQEVDNSIDSHGSSSSSSMSSSSMLQMYGGGVGGGLGSMGSVHNYRMGSIGGSSLSSMNGMGSSIGGGYGSYGAGNVIHWGRNDWRDVVLPAIPISHHYTQGMSYMIRGLDPDQHYEATVQARNRYGWSDYSQTFVFSTSSNDNEMRDLSVTFYGSASTRIHHSETRVILAALIIAYIRYFAI